MMESVGSDAFLSNLSDLGLRPVVVSPHLDDAVWSTGSLLHELVHAGQQPVVVSVFTDEPPVHLALTSLAAAMHDKWAGNPSEAWRQRQAEDRDALAHLEVTGHNLGFLDAIYRNYLADSLAGEQLLDSDADLGPQIVDALAPLLTEDPAEQTVVLPLGVGGHVDHLVCFELRTLLRPHAHRILFYEDFPYVTRPGDETRRHNSLGQQGLHPLRHHLEISPTAITAHQDAAARYISQVNNFRLPGSAEPHFPTRDHLDRDVEWLLHTRFGKAHPPCMTLWSL